MSRGGKRRGVAGKAYPQRTDLNAGPRTLPNQPFPTGAGGTGEWGSRAASQEAQSAVPVATPPTTPGGPQGAPQGRPGQSVRDVPNLADPTRRPDEPIEAGARFGPGGGPRKPRQVDPLNAQLRALYQVFPTQELRELIDEYELGS